MAINMQCPSCGKTLAAPDSAAGKQAKCPGCGQIMLVPAAIQQADAPGSPSYPQPLGPSGPQPSADSEARRPCPECGEMIVANAAKCRFCGAIFDPRLRAEMMKYVPTDENLSSFEWVLCILCAGIGCIVGIVYAIQGKPKGMKMVGISIAAAVVWNVLSVFIRLGLHPHHF